MSKQHIKRETRMKKKKYRTKAQKARMAPKEAVNVMESTPSTQYPTTEVPILTLSAEAAKKIADLVEGDPNHECGAFLIGNLCKDKITGVCISFVSDVYTDGKYGSGSDYEFTVDTQYKGMKYVEKNYNGEMHIIGTVHSHANHPAFYSATDYRMMNSGMWDQVHMVISPRYGEYVLTYKNREGMYNYSIALQTDQKVFRYERKNLTESDGNVY